jgi:hypothetical protein
VDAITEVASKVTLVASSFLPQRSMCGGTGPIADLDPKPLPASTRWSRKVFLCSVAEVWVPARFSLANGSRGYGPPPPPHPSIHPSSPSVISM